VGTSWKGHRHVERFYLKKLNDVELEEDQVKIRSGFAALGRVRRNCERKERFVNYYREY
jgi:hypothetical protein